ncbi:ATP-binding cassette domain-containing protein, partial [Thermus scotoductus]|uniref:ATP-binding cassette domain-containing protein n=1 Tax=Thermus scotoductus TaxID=37636 RepID=UPI003451B219
QAEGKVFLDGAEVRGRSPEALLSRGLVLVPEGRALLPGLSVEDNLLLGGLTRLRRRENLRPDLERVYTLFPRLLERRKQPAGTLSGGEQPMLAIGRAPMARPRVPHSVEPSCGLDHPPVQAYLQTTETPKCTRAPPTQRRQKHIQHLHMSH